MDYKLEVWMMCKPSIVQGIVKDVVGNDHNVSVNKKGTLILPWPTRNNKPVSEFTAQYFIDETVLGRFIKKSPVP
jgi:hypothetical protein